MPVWALRYHAAPLGSSKVGTLVGVQLLRALVQPSLGIFTERSRSRPTGELRPWALCVGGAVVGVGHGISCQQRTCRRAEHKAALRVRFAPTGRVPPLALAIPRRRRCSPASARWAPVFLPRRYDASIRSRRRRIEIRTCKERTLVLRCGLSLLYPS